MPGSSLPNGRRPLLRSPDHSCAAKGRGRQAEDSGPTRPSGERRRGDVPADLIRGDGAGDGSGCSGHQSPRRPGRGRSPTGPAPGGRRVPGGSGRGGRRVAGGRREEERSGVQPPCARDSGVGHGHRLYRAPRGEWIQRCRLCLQGDVHLRRPAITSGPFPAPPCFHPGAVVGGVVSSGDPGLLSTPARWPVRDPPTACSSHRRSCSSCSWWCWWWRCSRTDAAGPPPPEPNSRPPGRAADPDTSDHSVLPRVGSGDGREGDHRGRRRSGSPAPVVMPSRVRDDGAVDPPDPCRGWWGGTRGPAP